MLKVLGIDIASAEWSSIGNAVITFDSPSRTFQGVQAGVIRWPTATLTAKDLANTIDEYARGNGVCAIAFGWATGLARSGNAWGDTWSRAPMRVRVSNAGKDRRVPHDVSRQPTAVD